MSPLRVVHPSSSAAISRLVWSAALLGLLAVLFAAPSAWAVAAASGRATDIVQFRPGMSQRGEVQVVRAAGGRPGTPVPLIHGLAARLSERAAARLERDPRVRAVTPNGRVATRASRIDANTLANAYPATVMAPAAWATATGRGVTVAVIDRSIPLDRAGAGRRG